jgi:hypothetical protein
MGHRARSRVPQRVVALAFALALGCGEELALESYELSGSVTILDESGGGAPLPGARVTFTSDTLRVEETRADSEGRYRMRLETDHPFGQVRAEADGFFAREATVYFDSPQRRIDLSLRRRPN